MTARITTPSEPSLYDALTRLHGHRCPMSILGARLGLAARSALPEGVRVVARYFHQTCALDGIQLTTGCTVGNGNLHVSPRGEHRLWLWGENTPRGVEAALTPEALQRAQAYGRLRTQWASGSAGAKEKERAETVMQRVLRDLEDAPSEELVLVTPVQSPEEWHGRPD